MLQGEIRVDEFMQRASRLQDWSERQQRDGEWVALKQYWRAETTQDKQQVSRLYGQTLQRALVKYHRHRCGRRLVHSTK